MEPNEKHIDEILGQMTLKEKISLLSGSDTWNTVPIDRLGIPMVTMTDGPHGVRPEKVGRKYGPTTAFPTGVSMASSWNPELIEHVGEALAEETLGMDCDILLGPCVNIVRHPLAGRNFEAYSEDPYLAGRIGVAWVKGLQSRGVGASLKHYACNNQEIERMRGSSQVGERTLREIYLAQFEMIVKEAQPWTVMCAYNRINGVYASQHHYLLTEILRDEWGFKGVVVSDWTANHTIFESVQAGLDLEMPGPAHYYGRLLEEAVDHWQVNEAAINQATRRVLQMIYKSGKLSPDVKRPKGSVNTPEHQALARQLSEEAITLLKNENSVLPLNTNQIKSIAVIGPNASEMRVGGGGSSYVEPSYLATPLQALKARLGEQVEIRYEQGCDSFVELPALKSEYLSPSKGKGNGLTGEYFNNTTLDGTPECERVDNNINFWWYFHGPAENISIQKFSARWTGKLTVPQSGKYTVKLNNSATCRLYLDDQILIDHTRTGELSHENSHTWSSTQVELMANQSYNFKVEFIKTGDEPFAHVKVMLVLSYRPGEDHRLAKSIELASKSDVAIVFAGMPEFYESEGDDRPDMELPGPQVELIRAVAKSNPRTIVVLNAGAPVSMSWVNEIQGLVTMYYPGVEGGNAIARVLLGEVNPSGKLTVTYPRRLADTPAFINYPGTKEVHYGEGIFVGYRYYDVRDIEPLFPFGHGLSYTTYEYSNLQVSSPIMTGEPVQVSLSIKNTGKITGKEVVQLYISDKQASLPRPPKELKRFAKVALQPGEAQTIRFTLDQRAFSYYNPNLKRWIAEPGEYEVLVGSSSRDIRVKKVCVLE